MRLLVRGLARRHFPERLDGGAVVPALLVERGELDEQGQVSPPDLLPPTLRPILVAVSRQEVPGVEVKRGPVRRRGSGAAGLVRRVLESLDVRPQWGTRAQTEALVVQVQVAGGGGLRLEGPSGDVKGLVEVVGGGPGLEVGPEEVQDLLAVEASARRQGEQFDEARGLAQTPFILPDRPRTHPDLEAAEQPHAHEPGFRRLR